MAKSKEALFKLVPRVALMMKVFEGDIGKAVVGLGRKGSGKELKKVLLKHFMLIEQADLDVLVSGWVILDSLGT